MRSVTGTGQVLRLLIRLDRVRLLAWLGGLGGLIVVSTVAVPTIYDTPLKIAGYARALGASPVNYLMSGRQAGIDTLGGIVANETSQVAQLGICLMVVFLVVRHTRAEEETGRAELVRSTQVGRNAGAAATLVLSAGTALLVGFVTAAAMMLIGLDATGAVVYGLGLWLLALAYVGVALVTAQLTTSARSALGIALAAVGVGYLVRGIGAVQDSGLVWLSPFGWAQEMRAFGQERGWPAVLLVASACGCLLAAAEIAARRDVGEGVLVARPGPAHAAQGLMTPIGLVARLQRGLLLGWAIGMLALGALYGAVIPTIPELVESNPDLASMFGGSGTTADALVDAFLGYVFGFLALLATVFAVTSATRMKGEEVAGHADLVLAADVTRRSWVVAHLVFSVVGVVLVSMASALGLWVGYGAAAGAWDRLPVMLAGQLSFLPACLAVTSVAVVVLGHAPRRSALASAWLVVSALMFLLGERLRLPDPVLAISPFWHLPTLPVEQFAPVPAMVELCLAAALAALGLVGFARRDIEVG
jgi:ABC-2 type transport system permease protein